MKRGKLEKEENLPCLCNVPNPSPDTIVPTFWNLEAKACLKMSEWLLKISMHEIVCNSSHENLPARKGIAAVAGKSRASDFGCDHWLAPCPESCLVTTKNRPTLQRLCLRIVSLAITTDTFCKKCQLEENMIGWSSLCTS